MARPLSTLEVTPQERLQLQRVARSRTGSQRDGLRARIVLRRAEGAREVDVAESLGVSLTTVSTWSRRFQLQGLAGLKDRPGRGRKAWLAADKVRQVVTRVVQPPKGKKKWSTRSMAAAVGVSHQRWASQNAPRRLRGARRVPRCLRCPPYPPEYPCGRRR